MEMPEVAIGLVAALVALFFLCLVFLLAVHMRHQSKRAREFDAARRRIIEDIESGTRLTQKRRHIAAAPAMRQSAGGTATNLHQVSGRNDGRSYRRADAADLLGDEIGKTGMQMQWATETTTPEHSARMHCSDRHVSSHDISPSFGSCDSGSAAQGTSSCAPSCD